MIDSTRIVASNVFDRANRCLLAEALSDGGAHVETTVSGVVTLTPGLNQIEVQYDNSACCTTALELSGLPAAVPEPAAWAMLILGLGMIGWAARRRVVAHAA